MHNCSWRYDGSETGGVLFVRTIGICKTETLL